MSSFAETTNVRVLSWNLHHGVGEDGKLDLERIAKMIRDKKPDLVALQEIDQQCTRSGKVDQAAELARLTGMHGVFGKAMDFQGGAYGQAILSRQPIRESKVHALPGKGEPRIAFEVQVLIAGKELRFVSAHLDLDAGQRLKQTAILAKNFEFVTTPIILCGDFNDVPSSAPLAALGTIFKVVKKSPPVLTCPAGTPTEEIDYVLIKGLEAISPVEVIAESVASDHRPIMTDVLLP